MTADAPASRGPILIEACVDTVESARAAEAGGADRVELCADLGDGGTTPSHAAISCAVEFLKIPVFPIIRCRGGSFLYSRDDVELMRRDIVHARSLGVHGVVVGALTSTGEVDREAVSRWLDAADGLPVTFHRAIDVCRDPFEALEALVELGVARVLTSGQRMTASEGRLVIAEMVRRAAGRLVVMAGGSVRAENAAEIVRETGVREIHVRGTVTISEPFRFHEHAVGFRKPYPVGEAERVVTEVEAMQIIRTMLE